MLVVYDDSLTAHLSGVPHPEGPDRVSVVADELRRRGMFGEETGGGQPHETAAVAGLIHFANRLRLQAKHFRGATRQPETPWRERETGGRAREQLIVQFFAQLPEV